MKEFKKLKKRAVKLLKTSGDKNVDKIVKGIKKAKGKEELAFCLLDSNQHKIFAEIFETKDVKVLWPRWTEVDYQRYAISQDDFEKTVVQIDEAISKGKERHFSVYEIQKGNAEMIDRLVNVHLAQLNERKAIHDQMLAEIREIMTDKLMKLEVELSNLEKQYRRLIFTVKRSKRKQQVVPIYKKVVNEQFATFLYYVEILKEHLPSVLFYYTMAMSN